MSTKEEAHSQISALVERFTEQLPSDKKSDYNETLTRKDVAITKRKTTNHPSPTNWIN